MSGGHQEWLPVSSLLYGPGAGRSAGEKKLAQNRAKFSQIWSTIFEFGRQIFWWPRRIFCARTRKFWSRSRKSWEGQYARWSSRCGFQLVAIWVRLIGGDSRGQLRNFGSANRKTRRKNLRQLRGKIWSRRKILVAQKKFSKMAGIFQNLRNF